MSITPTKIFFITVYLASLITHTDFTHISTESAHRLKLNVLLNLLNLLHVSVHRIFTIYSLYFQNVSSLYFYYAISSKHILEKLDYKIPTKLDLKKNLYK